MWIMNWKTKQIKSITKQVIETGSDNLTPSTLNDAEASSEFWINKHNTSLHQDSQQTALITSLMQLHITRPEIVTA